MRLYRAFLCAVCFGIAVAGAAQALEEASIVGVWLFDEGGGDDIEDFSGASNDGEAMGATDRVDGKFGEAMEFEGGWVEIPRPDVSFSQGFTVTAWVNIPGPNGQWQQIVAQNGPVWPDRSFFIAVSDREIDPNTNLGGPNAAGSLHWSIVAPGAPVPPAVEPDEVYFNTTEIVATGDWVHVAATYDLEACRAYVNGVLEVEHPFTFELADSTWAIEIGRNLTGVVDDVLVANAAITEEEILSIMELGVEGHLTRSVDASGKLASVWGSLKAAPDRR